MGLRSSNPFTVIRFRLFCPLWFLFCLVGCAGYPFAPLQSHGQSGGGKSLALHYSKPASDWMTQALPLGNGKIGAMVFGGVECERLAVNEKSLWAGGPGEFEAYNGGNLSGGAEKIEEIRNAIEKGDYKKAQALADTHLVGFGAGFGAYQALGDILICFSHEKGKPLNYRRELDLNEAIHKLSYDLNGKHYERELFISYPHNLLVMHCVTTADSLPELEVAFQSPLSSLNYRDMFGSVFSGKNLPSIQRGRTLLLETSLQKRGERGTVASLTIDGKINSNGLAYQGEIRLYCPVGEIEIKQKGDTPTLVLKKGKECFLFFTAATDYTPISPTYKGNDFVKANALSMKNTFLSYGELKKRHLEDYQTLFKRVQFHLDNGNPSYSEMETDKRLARFSKTNEPALIELVYQYGRYLLIASSRSGALPANLQGIWNDSNVPPWCCDYHININLQMNYWMAEATNLSECHLPLLDYIQTLVEPGRKTVQNYYGIDGWTVHTMNNPFGFTAPGWEVGWGFFPGGGGWLCKHLYQHYLYTGDLIYLREKAYPVMKEAALFWLDYLQPWKTGKWAGYLVSTPSFSPEHGLFGAGASMDHQIAEELFADCIEASSILKVDEQFRSQLIEAKAKILPPQIGSWGQLQEWMEDRDDPKDKHRHISHLFALHPGRSISVNKNPELAEACKKSLKGRGDGGTGWSIAWKINFWARLLDGDHAWKLIKNLFRLTSQTEVSVNSPGALYANLLDAHPPFQIDGNMGVVSGITEMLLQSHMGKVHLLPALPSQWQSGSIKGIKAEGGFEIQMRWEMGQLVESEVTSLLGNPLTLYYDEKEISISTKKGETIKTRWVQ